MFIFYINLARAELDRARNQWANGYTDYSLDNLRCGALDLARARDFAALRHNGEQTPYSP